MLLLALLQCLSLSAEWKPGGWVLGVLVVVTDLEMNLLHYGFQNGLCDRTADDRKKAAKHLGVQIHPSTQGSRLNPLQAQTRHVAYTFFDFVTFSLLLCASLCFSLLLSASLCFSLSLSLSLCSLVLFIFYDLHIYICCEAKPNVCHFYTLVLAQVNGQVLAQGCA